MWDNISLALQSLRANKMRALLTMLGIIIGIGSVIAIKTVGNSLTGSITDSMSGFGIRNISVSLTQKESESSSKTSTESGAPRVRMFKNATPSGKDLMTDEMIEEYRATFPDDVAYVELTSQLGTGTLPAAEDSSDTVSATLLGINDEYLQAEQVELLYGRGIANTSDADRKVCVVADRFVEQALGTSPRNVIGQTVQITVNKVPYTFYIQGVYAYEEEDTVSVTSSFSDDVITNFYMPLETARKLAGSTGKGYQQFTVVTAADTDTASFLTTTQQFFETYYTQNDSWTVECSSLDSLVSTITGILDTVSLAISAIAAISLLVGGIGVMNIMLVSITERTREIGTRKALGAPQGAIRLQFIVEAVVICMVGGLLGIAVGTGLGALACQMLGYAAKADFATIGIAVGFSMVIGVFFGYYPANKAAKLDPIEALRYE